MPPKERREKSRRGPGSTPAKSVSKKSKDPRGLTKAYIDCEFEKIRNALPPGAIAKAFFDQELENIKKAAHNDGTPFTNSEKAIAMIDLQESAQTAIDRSVAKMIREGILDADVYEQMKKRRRMTEVGATCGVTLEDGQEAESEINVVDGRVTMTKEQSREFNARVKAAAEKHRGVELE